MLSCLVYLPTLRFTSTVRAGVIRALAKDLIIMGQPFNSSSQLYYTTFLKLQFRWRVVHKGWRQHLIQSIASHRHMPNKITHLLIQPHSLGFRGSKLVEGRSLFWTEPKVRSVFMVPCGLRQDFSTEYCLPFYRSLQYISKMGSKQLRMLCYQYTKTFHQPESYKPSL